MNCNVLLLSRRQTIPWPLPLPRHRISAELVCLRNLPLLPSLTSSQCDGTRPACTRCISRGQTCKYAGGEDGRKPASKTYVDLLRRRIRALEQVLRNHSIDIDASLAALSTSHPNLVENGSLPAHLDPGHGETSPDFEALCAAFEGALSTEEALNYEGDGEFRYYGPTSGRLHFMSDPATEQSPGGPSPQSQAVPADLAAVNPRADMNRQLLADDSGVPISEELKSELVDLYFTWQNPWLLVLDENIYRKKPESEGSLLESSSRKLHPRPRISLHRPP